MRRMWRALGNGVLAVVSGVGAIAACSSETTYNATYVINADGGEYDGALVVPDDAAQGADAAKPDGAITDAAADADADAASEETDSGSTEEEEDSGSEVVDSGVDAGACNGVVRYAVPAGSYAWGHRCSGFQLDTSVNDPPTQLECGHVGTTLTNQCVKWGSDKKALVIHFKQSSAPGQDCNIQIFPRLDGGDIHSCF